MGRVLVNITCYCVLCCTTAVPGTTCCSTWWHRRRSAATVRSLARLRRYRAAIGRPVRSHAAARSPAIVRSPAAALVIITTYLRYYTTTPEMCTQSAYYFDR